MREIHQLYIHGEYKGIGNLRARILQLTVLVLLLSTLVMSTIALTARAQSATIQNVVIDGSLILASYSINVCSAIYLGSCPISLGLSEHYTQPLSVQAQPQEAGLQPQTVEETLISVTPGSPSLVLDFNFSLGSDSYDYSIPLPALQAPGTFTETIPLTHVLANLVGLGLPTSLLSHFISLNVPISLVSSVQASPVASGFTTTQSALIWNDPSTVEYNATLTGTSEDSFLGLSAFQTVFSVNAQLELTVPLISPISMFSYQQNLLSFGSSASLPIGDWYHVALSSQYSQVSGAGWYLSGTGATISVRDQSVASSGISYGFSGWTGVGPGSYSGSQMSDTLTVTAPIQETASWQQSPAQVAPLITPESVAIVLGIVGAIAVALVAILIVIKGRNPRNLRGI
jgi:hypothetical protein